MSPRPTLGARLRARLKEEKERQERLKIAFVTTTNQFVFEGGLIVTKAGSIISVCGKIICVNVYVSINGDDRLVKAFGPFELIACVGSSTLNK